MSPRKRKGTAGDEAKAKLQDRQTSQMSTDLSSPGTAIPYRRILVRLIIAISMVIGARFYFGPPEKDFTLVKATDRTKKAVFSVKCSNDYDAEYAKFSGCVPNRCGRVVSDNVVTETEATLLLGIAQKGMAYGVANGGASILDLHSGALTKGSKFINVYEMMKDTNQKIFTDEDFVLYRRIKNKIHNLISQEFKIPTGQVKLYLTSPTFFSKMTTKPSKTIHDEYWHPHIDKETYGSFHYTSLLYLSTYGKDFTGGRFVFMDHDGNKTVEPRLGRLSFFTSGSENKHFVEKVESGTRYAITVSFTCDPQKAIGDPKLRKS